MKTEKIFSFESISEFGEHIKSLHDAGKQLSKASCSQDQDRDYQWTYGLNFNGALDMAVNGGNWEKGARDLIKSSVEANTEHELTQPRVYTDMVGFMPHVPNVVIGTPDSMLQLEEQPIAKRVIKIAVEVARPYFIKANEAMAQGRALLSIIDSFETQGTSVELYATRCSGNMETEKTRIEVCIKKAGEFWSAESAAFALCHPAFSRRLFWRMEEGTEELSHIPDMSYGNSINAKPEGFDVYIPYQMRDQQRACRDDAKALEFYTGMVMTQLAES